VCAQLAAAGARLARSGSQRPISVDAYGDALAAAPSVAHDHVAKLRHDPAINLLTSLTRGYAGTSARREDADVFGSVLAGVPPAGRAVLRRRRVPTVDLVVVLNCMGSAPKLAKTPCDGLGAPARADTVRAQVDLVLPHALRSVGHAPLPGR